MRTTDLRFEQFYEMHRPRIRAFVARRAAAHDVDDVLAEVFTVAWRNFATIDDTGPRTVGWLMRTAPYALANLHRSTQRRTRLAARVAAMTPLSGTLADPFLPAASAFDAQVAEVFRHLPSADRTVLLLVAWDDCTVDELAAFLGCKPSGRSCRSIEVRQDDGRLDRSACPHPTQRTAAG